ncbi:MAG: hypothetical protein ACQEXJ_00645 [Myxococcota bacterium]
MSLMRLSCTVVAALLALWTGPAQAAVPEASEMLERAAEAWPEAVPLVANLVEVREDAPPRAAIRVASDGAGHVRLEVQDLRRGETEVTRFAPAGEDAPEARPLDVAPAWLQWLVGRPVEEVAAAMGLDRERTSLDHAGGTILVVVGAGPRDHETPQIALERETGRLRALVERERQVLDAPARVLRVGAEGRAAAVEEGDEGEEGQEDPRARWPARLVMERGDEARTFRVEWLRMGDEVGPEPAPESGAEPGSPEETPPAPGEDASP